MEIMVFTNLREWASRRSVLFICITGIALAIGSVFLIGAFERSLGIVYFLLIIFTELIFLLCFLFGKINSMFHKLESSMQFIQYQAVKIDEVSAGLQELAQQIVKISEKTDKGEESVLKLHYCVEELEILLKDIFEKMEGINAPLSKGRGDAK